MKRQLQELAGWLDATGQHIEDSTVTGVSINSKTIKNGDLFIPFRGEKVNGHQFVKQAIELGAAASLWLKDEPDPPADLPLLFVDDAEQALQQLAKMYRSELSCTVIGITGSNGKTSTKDLVAGVLDPAFRVRKTEGNFNNELGLPLTILSLEEDTEVAVLEMGMSGFGEISFLSELAKPHYAVITNIGEAHMQDLGSREGIAKAKFEIIDGLQTDGVLYYDADEPLLSALLADHPEIETVSFGARQDADISYRSIEATDMGSRFEVQGLLEGQFAIPVYGAHQVKNALAAMSIAKQLGMNEGAIRHALAHAHLTDMRMQPVAASNGALFINDAYNAAPSSVRAAVQFMNKTNLRGDKWLVLGDMLELGPDEQRYHEQLADDIANQRWAGVLLYGPRMKWLYDELKRSGLESRLVWCEDDYVPLAKEIKENTGNDSIILLKGSRGMALEKLFYLVENGEEQN